MSSFVGGNDAASSGGVRDSDDGQVLNISVATILAGFKLYSVISEILGPTKNQAECSKQPRCNLLGIDLAFQALGCKQVSEMFPDMAETPAEDWYIQSNASHYLPPSCAQRKSGPEYQSGGKIEPTKTPSVQNKWYQNGMSPKVVEPEEEKKKVKSTQHLSPSFCPFTPGK